MERKIKIEFVDVVSNCNIYVDVITVGATTTQGTQGGTHSEYQTWSWNAPSPWWTSLPPSNVEYVDIGKQCRVDADNLHKFEQPDG